MIAVVPIQWHYSIVLLFKLLIKSSQQIFNSQNRIEQHAKFLVTDSKGRVGYGTLEIVVDIINGITKQTNRGVYTWERTKPQCED